MTTAIDHLAALTGYRDRDLLDVTLAHALMDLLSPCSVQVHKLVGEPGQQRWLLRARLDEGQVTAVSDPPWVAFEDLPARESEPLREQCVESQAPVAGVRGDRHLLLLPLFAEADAIGAIEVSTPQPLPEPTQRMVNSILRIYRNFHGLLDYSERDTLTGLLNRKTFDEAFLKTAHAQNPAAGTGNGERRSEAPVPRHWLGVVDIDHFKLVNDRYGHLIGDEVLLLVARILRSTFRFQDRLYRFGGEEFVALLRCTSEEDAASAFERLRLNMETYGFPQVGRVTASIGFTEVQPGDAPTAAFERADQAVYYAKQHGRNQVCGYGDLVRRGLLKDSAKVGDIELF
ncbi:GGDEF domain-containing protein [Aquabacterium sp. A7-Y]|uniref:GGDEF domain-containing protein n=1 Tax=Aquabacterium sp. A7-Y TaxID=1349605 RepID=UPI00223DFF47|nr:GGDEF domain-containing protein [Aquabacterium sp. A7-Y]MCW7537437.1 GGDEF domain-containing protein [Aquabacterium sp. A7-Y]